MRKIIIIGAGEAGNIIARQFGEKKHVKVIGYLDDNQSLHNKKILNISVLGGINKLKELVKKNQITEAIVAIPSLTGKNLTPIIKQIINLDLPYQITPGYYNFRSQDVDIKYPLRRINIEDLLGRHEVNLPIKRMFRFISDKKILITGAGGSIGSEIARICAMLNPKIIYLFGRGEGSIFAIQSELSLRFPHIKTKAVICNCFDKEATQESFQVIKPEIVFHAAAHKHVPYMESHRKEGFKNNVIGAINVFDAAIKNKAKKVVNLSTDKAVHPKSFMGITKRIVECLIQNDYCHSKTVFSAVRFGNVLGSRGSVVELFQNQIEAGGPITITHKNATRYFMTIPEAAQLVLVSGSIAVSGGIYVLDMGKQVAIEKLAKDLISLYGLHYNKDIKIKYVGLRPGEKIKESLLHNPECKRTLHQKIWKEFRVLGSKMLKSRLLCLFDDINNISETDLYNQCKKLIKQKKL